MGGNITLYISRAGVGASIFIDDIGGSRWNLELQYCISWSELVLFHISKHFLSVLLIEANDLVGFGEVAGAGSYWLELRYCWFLHVVAVINETSLSSSVSH